MMKRTFLAILLGFAVILALASASPTAFSAEERAPAYEVEATVSYVTDGDTINVTIENIVADLDPEGDVQEDGSGEIRFAGGVDAPETWTDPPENGGPEATDFVENLLPRGTPVYLNLDNKAEGGEGRPYRGQYGRLVAVVFTKIDGQWVNVNAQLLRWGAKNYPNHNWLAYSSIPSEFDGYEWLENKYPYVLAPDNLNEAPVPTFNYSPSRVSAGESMSFDASSSHDDNTIVSYEWIFDDGETAAGKTVTHTYSKEGTYVVKLKVMDDDGVSSMTSKSLEVSPLELPSPGAVERMSTDRAVKELSSLSPELAARILENVSSGKAGEILNEFTLDVKSPEMVKILKKSDRSKAASWIQSVDPSTAALITKEIAKENGVLAAELVDQGAKQNLDLQAQILGRLRSDMVADLLIRVFDLPATPEAAADLLQAMSLEKSKGVIESLVSHEKFSYVDEMFSHLSSEKLNSTYESLSSDVKGELKPHLSSGVKSKLSIESGPSSLIIGGIIAAVIIAAAVLVYWKSS